jgi:hypothetical protein
VVALYAKEYGGVFRPEDLALLQKLFDEVCEARGYAPDSEQSEYMALLIFTLFNSGFVNETSLRKALEDNRSQT